MKKTFLLLCLSFLYCVKISAQDVLCGENTGVAYGSVTFDERGISLIPTAENDGIYITGTKEDSLLLIRQDLAGNTIWARAFDIVPNLQDYPTSIIIDNEGMIAICGVGGDKLAGGAVFVFRYDAQDDQILWAQQYASSPTSTCYTMLQKGTGNYVLSTSPIFSNGNIDAELLEIDQATGAIVPDMSTTYSLEHVESLLDITYDGNFIWGTGRYEDGFGLDDLRTTVAKIDPVTGDQLWAKMGHIPENLPARLYGWAILIESDSIVIGSYGDPEGPTTTNAEIYLHKSDLDGNVTWCRQYELSGQTSHFHEVLRVADGYVILATTINVDQEIILLKTDLLGNLLWAKKFDFEHDVNLEMEYFGKRKLIELNGQLIFTAYGRNNTGDENIIVIKTNLQGEVENECLQSFDFTVPVVDIITEYYDVTPTQVQADPDVIAISPEFGSTLISSLLQCVQTDTLFTIIDTSVCIGQDVEGYSTTGEFIDVFTAANGCDSIRTLNLIVVGCDPIIHWGLEACESFMHNGSHMDFTEFLPDYPNELPCADIEASHVNMEPSLMNKHSCTPGVNGSVAMCIGTLVSCSYAPGDIASLVIEFSIDVPEDSSVQITGFEFYEKSPATYSWISGPSGPNNYPRFYGIRILKNGTEIFQQSGISTTQNWSLQRFDFVDNELFTVDENTDFRIELLPYCPVGNGAEVSAWDIDEISILGGCIPFSTSSSIMGGVFAKSGKLIPNTFLHLAGNASFASAFTMKTNDGGQYIFDDLGTGAPYYIKGYKNDHILQGVSTLDLLRMQKHLLGVEPFTSLRQYIAADINHNGSISAVDILELQKMLLGYYVEFPRNSSWRFGVLPQEFSGTDISTFTEVGYLESLQEGPSVIDFEGIKIGDVNEDIKLTYQDNLLTTRDEHTFEFRVHDDLITKGEQITIEVRAGRTAQLHGFQMALRCHELSLVTIEGIAIPLSDNNFRFSDQGELSISWYDAETDMVMEDEILFRIKFISEAPGMLSENLEIQSSVLQSEAYIGNELKTHAIQFAFTSSPELDVHHSFRIEPNPVSHQATLTFNLPKGGETEISFFDLSGHLIHTIEKEYPSGEQSEVIYANELLPGEGVVYCRLVNNGFTSTQKLVLLR